ncbi:aminoglycoside phosphotransferase family protein [Heyndrickxia acidiproducens]|uniref:aminoglycoside phosphotransferase family protein n=1 Tax=Heyndrickxia acidiproducens TaxID=1121084 RepID=UPI000377A9D6|nr:aminoglycoside phosphotransferase family protein [Heyndrickxia acidiproducens]
MGGRNKNEGDDFQKRLLLYAEKRLDEPVTKIKRLRKQVWFVETKRKKWVLKEFSDLERLNRQIVLTEALHQAGFKRTYRFLPAEEEAVFMFGGRVWGIMEYIEPGAVPLRYESEKEILAAYRLLKIYHGVTARFPRALQTEFPRFFQIKKWQQRYREFAEHETELLQYMPAYYFESYLSWAETALEELEARQRVFHLPPYCITHGDVAHHNFLKGKDGKLYLIDFDLARMAPAWTDDLQFCNRILPSISWSLRKLLSWNIVQQAADPNLFLKALAYPTDVLREWNRFLKSGSREKEKQWPELHDLTFSQFEERKAFVKEMKRLGGSGA